MIASLDKPRTVVPTALRADLLLTFDSAISHHDPAKGDDSNTLVFNRQAKLVPAPTFKGTLAPETLTAFCGAHPVPAAMSDIARMLDFPQFVACVLYRMFSDIYNSADGTGLFAGEERWPRLETRFKNAARALSLRGFWSELCASMQVPIHPARHDETLLRLFALPRAAQSAVLAAIVNEHAYRSIGMVARFWHEQNKLTSKAYAEKAGAAHVTDVQVMEFSSEQLAPSGAGAGKIELPHLTANTLRHVCVRHPGWLHLAGALGLRGGESAGAGELDLGTEAMFVNGGNIASGAKQPSNPFGLAQKIRRAYPLLDLLGGVTNSFDLGASKLRVNSTVVCRENRDALAGSRAHDLPNATTSVFDMTDEVTHTRQAHNGRGQMIYNFETLAAGAQVLARFTFAPFTHELTQGAFVAAMETYLANAPTAGGQSARGYGSLRGEWLAAPEGDFFSAIDDLNLLGLRAKYEQYLDDNRDALRASLCDGTLGTGTLVVS